MDLISCRYIRDAQLTQSLTFDGNRDCACFGIISQRVESSTYLTMFSWDLKSFTMMRNSNGPSLVPWGTPDETDLHSEKWEPILTGWVLLDKKLASQFKRTWGWTFVSLSLLSKILSLMQSNALEKSNKQMRKEDPGWSIASCHFWSR